MLKNASHKILSLIILTLILVSCDNTKNQSSLKSPEMETMQNNMLANILLVERPFQQESILFQN
jgi:hypothetical protein